jgi:hypothetical protein
LIKPEKELPVSPPPLTFNVAKEKAHYVPMQENLNPFSIWSFFGKGGGKTIMKLPIFVMGRKKNVSFSSW